MEGLIVYFDLNGEEQRCYYSGKYHGESNSDYLKREGIQFLSIKEAWQND